MKLVFESGKPVRVLGIDEVGLGPSIGPLMIVAVLLEGTGEPLYEFTLEGLKLPYGLTESKRFFRQRSLDRFQALEMAALDILSFSGGIFGSACDLLERFALRSGVPAQCRKAAQLFCPPFKLPVWTDRLPGQRVLDVLKTAGYTVLGVRIRYFTPLEWNQKRERGESYKRIVLEGFRDLLTLLPWDTAILGKVGRESRYLRFLRKAFGSARPLRESSRRSSYRLADGREVHFLQNADEQFLPVALASVIAKYFRELSMLAHSQAAGFPGPIPKGSGYRHDRGTQALEQALRKWAQEKEISPDCLFRKR